MEIKKMTACFGKLDNETIEFKPGLNVVSRPNEAGKSTWCAFIRDMLYGVDSSQRAKAGYLPDKTRYAPWSGAPMQGSMELNAGGKDITLMRTTRSKNAPMREFTAVYTGTNVPVEGLTGADAGEKLTGVSRDVFCRSAFIEQGGLATGGSPELEKRIASIVSTGEEDTSYTEADERLRGWQRARRYNRHGRLPELDDVIENQKRRLEAMASGVSQREDMQRRLAAADERCASLENQVTESRKRCRKEVLEKLGASRDELTQTGDAYNDICARARADRASLERNVLGGGEPDQVLRRAKDDKARSEQLRRAAESRATPMVLVICLILALAALAMGITLSPLIYIGAGIFAVAAVLTLVYNKKKNAGADAAAEERRGLLAKYAAHTEADIDAAVEEFNGLYAACMASEQEERDARIRLDAIKKRHDQLESSTLSDLDFENGGTLAASLGRELAAAREERARLGEGMAQADGRIETMGDPLVIRTDIENKTGEYDRVSREYDAISLAADTLRQADAEIQSRFSPALGRCAAEYMSFMTGGKYQSVLINRDFSIKTGTDGDSVPRDSEYLSAGTLDLMYLAVRLAVCSLALPEQNKCPVILDDPLVNLDSERKKQAQKLLEQTAKERQVIIFTCN